MIYISGMLTDDCEYKGMFDEAEEYLIDTQTHHSIYGTKDIINPAKIAKALPDFTYRQHIDLTLYLLSMCDTIYMLKNWESSAVARVAHEYASMNGYRIIYSKKF